MRSPHRAALPALLLAACSSGGDTSPDAATPAADAGSGAQATIGPTGGTLALGAVSIEVPAGAVSAPTVFRISPVAGTPTVPADSAVVSPVYRLEPAQTFAAPIRVTVTVDASKVPGGTPSPGDGFLLLKAPSGTDDFEPVGAADPGATQVVASVTSFSDLFAMYLRTVGCDPIGLQACSSGRCVLETADAVLSASCEATAPLEVTCSCRSSDPSRLPVVTGPLRVADLASGRATLALYTFLQRCGWPCHSSPADGGVPSDSGTPAPDAAVPADGGVRDGGAPIMWTAELVGSDAAWHQFSNFRVGGGWITWADPTVQELSAMHTDATGRYTLPYGTYSRFLLELAVTDGIGQLGLIRLGGTTPRYIDIEVDMMTTRRLAVEAAYVGITPNAVYTNDPHFDPVTQLAVNPFSSIPLTGGRATVLSDHFNAGPIESDPSGVFFYGSDRNAPEVCGLYSEAGGAPLIPDEVLCRSSLQPIRVTPGFVLWQRIDAMSMPSLVVMRRSDNRLREFTEVRRAFAASGEWVYFLTASNDLARARLDGDGVSEPLGITVPAPSVPGMAAGGDGYIYWAIDTGGVGSIYRLAVP